MLRIGVGIRNRYNIHHSLNSLTTFEAIQTSLRYPHDFKRIPYSMPCPGGK